MARYMGPVCRICRRQGEKLMLKGGRCFTPKCPLERKRYPPGQRGTGRPKKMSEYGVRLLEKQKAKHIYGVLERQMRRHFAQAEKLPGRAGENLVTVLETRLDSVIYRAGFVESRRQARQLVQHGYFTINGRRTNIPSVLVKPGDVIAWKQGKDKRVPYESAAQSVAAKHVPAWLSVDDKSLAVKVLSQPSKEDIDVTINGRLIVELYSR